MADSKGKISSELIEQKLILFNSSQESVQAMSLWIMHNKAHHQKIVDTWMKVLKKSDSKHKLTLFYLCNDVVQHAKKKKALYYLENFKDHLREAVQVVREYESIKPNIERIFKIWDERRTYDAKFIKELRGILEGGSSSKSSSASGTPAQASPVVVYKPSSKEHKHRKKHSNKEHKHISSKEQTYTDKELKGEMSKNESEKHVREIKDVRQPEETPDSSGEFKPSTFLEQMSSLKKLEGEVTLKAKQLAALRIDATNIEAVKQLKDRSHGNEFCRQFEESCVKIEDYVAMLEKEIHQRRLVLSVCDNAEDFFCTQFDEAKVVANAYKNFGARVTNMKKRVDDMKKIIPTTPSPVPSPTADAPSPGNSPPLLNMDDNETVDMDLCIEDSEQPKPQDQIPKEMSETGSQGMLGGTFQGTNILETRIATMLPNLAKGSSGMNSMPPSDIGSHTTDVFGMDKPPPEVPDVYTPPPRLDQLPPQPVPPVQPVAQPVPPPEPMGDDAGSSTPVQDEPEEKEEATPPLKQNPASKPGETKTKTNPIDFLSQLLTKTSSSSSSSNFLQTLSLLTNTVKTQYQKKQNEDGGSQKEEEEEPKPPSPTFAPGITDPVKPTATEFVGVPPPVPTSQASSWSSWKQVNSAQPDPSSPPVISQPKTPDLTHHPPPLPQHPPPSEPVPSGPYNMQPPSPQDFSLPPPIMRQSVSQSFINPPPPLPPPPSNSQQFNTHVSSASFQQGTNTQAGQPVMLSASVAPTSLPTPQPSMGFTPNVPFGLPPPTSNSSQTSAPSQPLNPVSGFPQPPVPGAVYPQAPNQPPPPMSGFSQPLPQPPLRAPAPVVWEPQQPVGSETVQQNIQPPFIRGPFAPPPPPPNTVAQQAWQPENASANSRPNQNFSNQIASVQRSGWNNQGSRDYDNNWEGGMSDRSNQSGGYAHPWDQPQNYEEEEDENEFVDEILETSLPPAPKKSILRNSRTSSLREVTLVEETSKNASQTDEVTHFREHKPVSILKKPTDTKPIISNNDSTQSEFINILKQKSGSNSNLPDAPPSSRTLTTISAESFGLGYSVGNVSGNNSQGEPISTIGVVGSSKRTSSVQSDDMDVDRDDPEYGNDEYRSEQWKAENEWMGNQQNSELQGGSSEDFSENQDFDKHKNFESGHQYERHQTYERHSDFDRRDFNGPPQRHQFDRHDFNGPPPRPRWPEQRPWQHRAPGPSEHGGFHPRGGFPPRPRFQDNFRGPSPAKRPYFPPRQRMPFNRY